MSLVASAVEFSVIFTQLQLTAGSITQLFRSLKDS